MTKNIADKYGIPPQTLPLFVDTKDSIPTDIKAVLDAQRAVRDNIVSAFTPDTATFEGVMEAVARDNNQASLKTRLLSLYGKVSPCPELRDASSKARQAVADFDNESFMRQDIFDLIDALYNRRESLDLDAEDLRLLERTHQSYISNGMGIAEGPQRDRLREVKSRLNALRTEFNKNLNSENGGLWFTPAELEGVPDDVVSNLENGSGENEGLLWLTFKYPHLLPTLKYAISSETRKKVAVANENKCNQNSPLFKESIVLRNEMAQLLGFQDFSSYALEDKLAKTTEVVSQFLDNLCTKLTPQAHKELKYLQKLKAEECKARSIPDDGEYYFWDHWYYRRLLTETEYEVDELKVSEYFSLDNTVAGMLRIFETVMGFVFIQLNTTELTKLSPTGKAEDVVWHSDVIVYSVWDDESEGHGFVGYLFMDLHPRTGKYSHECNTNFQPGFTYKDGSRHYPSTALICNFTPPAPQKPSLLKHHEVVTLFHELGHGIHSLAAKTRYSRNHGTAVAWDFVEAPSQMLENWCWTRSVLKSLSMHWSTEEQIPDELVQKLVATRKVTMAIQHLIQLHYSLFDQVCHTTKTQSEAKAIETSSLFNELRVAVTMMKGLENESNKSDWGHHDAIFGHLMSGYQATYYGYLYSEVVSADMFHTLFKKDPMDKKQGRRYRHILLEYGGSRDEMESLKELLGRKPSSGAFYRELGIAD